MVYLSLSLLGPFQAWTTNGSLQTFRTLKERALLSYLVAEHSHPHRRDMLAEMFWPDRSEGIARNNLRQALYGIRQVIGQPGFDMIFSVTTEDVQANLSDKVWLDLAAYEVHLKAAQVHHHPHGELCPLCIQHLRDAVELYRGSFLEDMVLEKPTEFQNWVDARRQEVLQTQVQSLEALIQQYERTGDYSQAAIYAMRQIPLDDLNQARYQRLMTLLAKVGRVNEALEWYEICIGKLADAFGTGPSAEIAELAQEIQEGSFEPASSQSPLANHNLPDYLTPFLGREMEIAQVSAALENPSTRLINVIGMGGAGKTRFAVQAARLNLRQFYDGVYFVSLETVNAPEGIIESIGQVIGLVPGVQEGMRSVLLGYLRLKHILLVLDNFEHLVEHKGLLLEILQAAPYLKIMLTSRERLNLQAEHVTELGGLAYPEEGAPETPVDQHTRPQSFAAVRLFLERASRVSPNGLPARLLEVGKPGAESRAAEHPNDHSELESAIRICQLVNGLPLGIELAASLARDHTIREIADEVQQSIDFLSSSFQDIPERQRSLRISFEHSWDLLPESEREVFSRLSIFPANFSSAAAQAVAGAALPWLMRLEDRSLVRRIGHGRYDLHPTIRQYASQKLRQFSRRVEDLTLQQHAEYYCAFLSDREFDLRGRRQADALHEIAEEFENIQAAWDWAVEKRAFDLLERSAFSMMYFLEISTRWREGETRFRSVVDSLNAEPGEANHQPAGERFLATMLAYLGWFECRLSSYTEAETLLLKSLELLTDKDAFLSRPFAHFALGFLYTWMGRFKEAWLHLSTCQALALEMDNPWAAAWASEVLTEIAFESGQTGLVEQPFLQSLASFEKIGEQRGCSRALNYLGNIALARGRYAEARAYFERLLVIADKIGDIWGAAGGYTKLGGLAFANGEYEHAWRLHRRSLLMFQKMGDQRRSAFAFSELGEAACALGRPEEARELFRNALEIAARLRNTSLVQEIITSIAAVLLQGGQSARAVELLAVVSTEPISDQLIANRLANLTESARARLTSEQVAAITEAAGSRQIWHLVDDFLREGVPV